jgi:hypothetical protein
MDSSVPEATYLASDLQTDRRAFLNAARQPGGARLRDTDGTTLVMLPLATVSAHRTIEEWAVRTLQVTGLLRGSSVVNRGDLGALAWLAEFDDADRATFFDEFRDAVVEAHSLADAGPVERCLADWKTTARALADPKRRRVLTSPLSASDMVEVAAPDKT